MENRELRSLDFFMGIAFVAVGVFMSVSSLQMFRDPMLSAVRIVSNPGMTSLVIGGLLVVMGGALAAIGWSGAKQPFRHGIHAIRNMLRGSSFWKSAIVLALVALYFFVMWPLLPFWASTAIFLALTMFLFKAGAWWKILLISGVTTAVVVYFFGVLAKVPLP